MPESSVTKNVVVYLVEKLGFPIFFILLAWFRFLEPAMQRHFEDMDDDRRAREALVKVADTQTQLLSSIRADAAETAAWTRVRAAGDREQLEILKKIEQHNGM